MPNVQQLPDRSCATAGVSQQIHRSATIYKTFTNDADIRITEIVISDMRTLLPDDTQFVL